MKVFHMYPNPFGWCCFPLTIDGHQLRLMGVNHRILPRLDLRLELLPQPYAASRDSAIVEQNFRITLDLLGVTPGRRSFLVSCDETVWHPTLDIISGLKDEFGYVGSYFHETRDNSFLTRAQFQETTEDDLSRLSQRYIVSRIDTNQHLYCVDAIPRPVKALGLKANSASSVFVEMGRCLENACKANQDMPPIGVSYDGGTSHTLINKAFLGLMKDSEMEDVPFFRHCKVKAISLPRFSFGCLLYKDDLPIFGCLDPGHALKRMSYHLATSGRCVQFGDYAVELALLLRGGLAARAYAATDIQSDKDASRKLNPGSPDRTCA